MRNWRSRWQIAISLAGIGFFRGIAAKIIQAETKKEIFIDGYVTRSYMFIVNINNSQSKTIPEVIAIKNELNLRGWTAHELARRCGLAVGTVRNCLSLNNQCPTTRKKIEQALGREFWSLPGDLPLQRAANFAAEEESVLT